MVANTSLSSNNNPRSWLALLLLSYCLTAFLLWARIIPFDLRFQTLVFMTTVMICFTVVRKYSLKDLGFRSDTLKNSLIWNACLSLLLIAGMYIAFKENLIRDPTAPDWKFFFFFYIFISSPAQEFLFRSIVFAEMNRAKISPPFLQVLLSALIYSFIHVFYVDLITLIVTFIMGVLWGIIYYKYPNFWGVAFSHAILGIASIEMGLI